MSAPRILESEKNICLRNSSGILTTRIEKYQKKCVPSFQRFHPELAREVDDIGILFEEFLNDFENNERMNKQTNKRMNKGTKKNERTNE